MYLPREVMCALNTLSQDSFQKHNEKKCQKKKEIKDKGTWVELRGQQAPPMKYTLGEPTGRETWSHEFMA